MRNLHIDDKIWKYKVGKRCVEMRSPEGVKSVVSIEYLLNLPYEMDENTKLEVLPSDVKTFIQNKFLTNGATK